MGHAYSLLQSTVPLPWLGVGIKRFLDDKAVRVPSSLSTAELDHASKRSTTSRISLMLYCVDRQGCSDAVLHQGPPGL
jgi:hypothetical protein